MEALRYLLAACFFGLAAAAFLLFGNDAGRISVSGAQLTPMGDSFALLVNIDNPGAPDKLLGVGSEAASNIMLMGADSQTELAIPAQSTPSLAMDGAHAMITNIVGDSGEGRLLPITLWFERSGGISTRARITSGMMMDHSTSYDVPTDAPQPSVTLQATPNRKGWDITLSTQNFTFDQDAADGPHTPGTGHAHLYLNGLKLQRVYSNTVTIGALPPGDHTVRVTLNTNDHKTFHVNGAPVSATLTLKAD